MLFTKLPHLLDQNGELAADLPGPGRRLAEFICSIVQSVTSLIMDMYLDQKQDPGGGVFH